jgi:hypothetical protein
MAQAADEAAFDRVIQIRTCTHKIAIGDRDLINVRLLAHFADSNPTSPRVREMPKAAVSNRSKADNLLDHLVGGTQRVPPFA